MRTKSHAESIPAPTVRAPSLAPERYLLRKMISRPQNWESLSQALASLRPTRSRSRVPANREFHFQTERMRLMRFLFTVRRCGCGFSTAGSSHIKTFKRTIEDHTPWTVAWDSEMKKFSLRAPPPRAIKCFATSRIRCRQRRLTIGRHASPWARFSLEGERNAHRGSLQNV